jgi:hypothetical protein
MANFYEIYYGGEYDQTLDEMPNEDLTKLVDDYSKNIDIFKKTLYDKIVSKDTQSNNDSKDPIYKYHALYLYIIAYLISLLDHRQIPEPNMDEDIKPAFDGLVKNTQNIINSGSDSRVLAYNVLNKKSIERPEFFNVQQQDER